MLKTLKWAYGLGAKHERQRIEREMFQRLGTPPEESLEALPTNRQLERYYRARNRWYAIQGFLNSYYSRYQDFDPDQIEKLLEHEL